MITKSGLIGVYQPPLVGNQTNSIYMLTDETTQTLFVLILYPGSYDDIYAIASLTWYRNIILVPVSLGSYFISDIVRLVQDLTTINKKVSVLSPDKFPKYLYSSQSSTKLLLVDPFSYKHWLLHPVEL